MYQLEKLEVYQLAMTIAEKVWNLCLHWDDFNKRTLGMQMVRAADSIALNIAEGYGRFHHKELRQFCFIARGSLLETKSCLEKAHKRDLVNHAEFDHIVNDANRVLMMLNKFISSLEKKDFL